MPIKVPEGLRRLSYEEFATAAYKVMEVAFSVHREFGRLFDEPVYQHQVASQLCGARVEVPIEVSHQGFRKTYYLDLIWAEGALFEFKAVEELVDRHRAQVLNYLMLADLEHGKLVNMRPRAVEHEFVNVAMPREERLRFGVDHSDFAEDGQSRVPLRDLTVSILRDWGVGLDIELYEEALTYFLGGASAVIQSTDVRIGGRCWPQKIKMAAPGSGLKITALGNGKNQYEQQLRKFLAHSSLDRIQWINIGRSNVNFKTLMK